MLISKKLWRPLGYFSPLYFFLIINFYWSLVAFHSPLSLTKVSFPTPDLSCLRHCCIEPRTVHSLSPTWFVLGLSHPLSSLPHDPVPKSDLNLSDHELGTGKPIPQGRKTAGQTAVWQWEALLDDRCGPASHQHVFTHTPQWGPAEWQVDLGIQSLMHRSRDSWHRCPGTVFKMYIVQRPLGMLVEHTSFQTTLWLRCSVLIVRIAPEACPPSTCHIGMTWNARENVLPGPCLQLVKSVMGVHLYTLGISM